MARVALAHWPGTNVRAYNDRLTEAGLGPVDLCPRDSEDFATCDALLLPGGVDVDPRRYGASPGPRTQAPVPERDEFELALIASALARDLPVLAICRGHQLLNVAFGGSLPQHIENGCHEAQGIGGKLESQRHMVSIVPASRLGDLFPEARLEVNSRHHQAVTPEILASGLRAMASTDDGLVEAIESTDHGWVVGVQWHPERLEPELYGFRESTRRLFAAFAAAVRAKHVTG
jgi:putative glutamine amidotransferase